MEPKKNKKYDLERQRPAFFGIAMVIVLSMTLAAFEWKSPVDPMVDLTENQLIVCRFDFPLPEKNDEYAPPLTKWIPSGNVITNDPSYESDPIDQKALGDSVVIISCGLAPVVTPEPAPEKVRVSNKVYTIVETMPVYPGGHKQLREELQSNLKYPQQAARLGVEGRVFVRFVVEKDGSLSDFEVMKGIGAGCNEEAIRVTKLLDGFSPGMHRDIPVRVQMIVPIKFKLQPTG